MLSVIRHGRKAISLNGSLVNCMTRAQVALSAITIEDVADRLLHSRVSRDAKGSRRARFHSSEQTRHSRHDEELGWSGPGSHDASTSDTMDSDIMDRLCDKALEYVPTYGWSKKSLGKAAEELGLSRAIVGSLTRGPAELVEYFHAVCNQELEEILSKKCEDVPDLREMLVFGLKTRLSMILPYKDCWSEALALQASPTEAPYAFENTSKIADIVWRYAGDRSSDFTWYSKRAILMGIYTGAEVYLLADKSEDAKDTFDFIERGVRDLVV